MLSSSLGDSQVQGFFFASIEHNISVRKRQHRAWNGFNGHNVLARQDADGSGGFVEIQVIFLIAIADLHDLDFHGLRRQCANDLDCQDSFATAQPVDKRNSKQGENQHKYEIHRGRQEAEQDDHAENAQVNNSLQKQLCAVEPEIGVRIGQSCRQKISGGQIHPDNDQDAQAKESISRDCEVQF